MKQRHLRSGIEWILSIIATMLFVLLMMIDSMELRFVPIYLSLALIEGAIIAILAKYGKGVMFDGNED